MSIILKGFPTEISEEIELPSIAELLTYPIFFDMPIDQAYRYGTDFQRKLIDMTPIRGTKRHISILSEVKFLDPFTRSCTGFSEESLKDGMREFHIDSEEKDEENWIGGYEQDTDYIHLLSSPCTAMTEFNLNETLVDFPPGKPMPEYIQHIRDHWDQLDLKIKEAPANRIITFTNHLHRAKSPQTYEFRYMFRIVETDRKRPPSMNPYDKNYITRVMTPEGVHVPNVQQLDDRIIIYIPKSLRESIDYRPGPELSNGVESNRALTAHEALNYEKPVRHKTESSAPKVNTMNRLQISVCGWENSAVAYNSRLLDFTPKNSIMLISFGDYSDYIKNLELDKFFENTDRTVRMIDSKGNEIKAFLFKDFYDIDQFLGPIAGSYIQLTEKDTSELVSGESYKIVFNEDAPASFKSASDLLYIHK